MDSGGFKFSEPAKLARLFISAKIIECWSIHVDIFDRVLRTTLSNSENIKNK